MRVIGWLLAACVIMALLRLAVAVLAIALCILVIWGAINRPREALVIAGLIGFVSMAQNNPAVLIVLSVVVLVACLIGKAMERY